MDYKFRGVVLKGVTKERGSITAAGALVNKDVPRYAVVGSIASSINSHRSIFGW